jgi:hypothetical protein
VDYRALKNEVDGDPASLGYAGKTNQQIVDLLNATNTGRTLPNTAVPVQDIFNAIDNADWPAVASVSESKLQTLLQMPSIDASNANTRAIMSSIFGAGTQTRTNLLALANRTVSRAQELGLEPVTLVDVRRIKGEESGW